MYIYTVHCVQISACYTHTTAGVYSVYIQCTVCRFSACYTHTTAGVYSVYIQCTVCRLVHATHTLLLEYIVYIYSALRVDLVHAWMMEGLTSPYIYSVMNEPEVKSSHYLNGLENIKTAKRHLNSMINNMLK